MNLKVIKKLTAVLMVFCLFGLFPKAKCVNMADFAEYNVYVERFEHHYLRKVSSLSNPAGFFRVRATVMSGVIASIKGMLAENLNACISQSFISEMLSLGDMSDAAYEIEVALIESYSCKQFLENLEDMRLAYDIIAILYEGEFNYEGGQRRRHSIELTSYVPRERGLYSGSKKV